MLYLEYKKLNLLAELHIFTKGGHGFGMRKEGKPINEWPQRCGEWMESLGLLKPWLPASPTPAQPEPKTETKPPGAP
jgi:hypothetical protein